MKPASGKKILSYSSADCFLLRQRRMNPRFCGDEMQDKADPECDAEKFMGRQARKAAGGKERANDGADSSHGDSDGKGANHPLAVQRDFAPPDIPKRLAQRE